MLSPRNSPHHPSPVSYVDETGYCGRKNWDLGLREVAAYLRPHPAHAVANEKMVMLIANGTNSKPKMIIPAGRELYGVIPNKCSVG